MDLQGRELVLIEIILRERQASFWLVDWDDKLADAGGVLLYEAEIAKLRWDSAVGEAIKVVGTAEHGKFCSRQIEESEETRNQKLAHL